LPTAFAAIAEGLIEKALLLFSPTRFCRTLSSFQSRSISGRWQNMSTLRNAILKP
jgi:hypothetical protein